MKSVQALVFAGVGLVVSTVFLITVLALSPGGPELNVNFAGTQQGFLQFSGSASGNIIGAGPRTTFSLSFATLSMILKSPDDSTINMTICCFSAVQTGPTSFDVTGQFDIVNGTGRFLTSDGAGTVNMSIDFGAGTVSGSLQTVGGFQIR